MAGIGLQGAKITRIHPGQYPRKQMSPDLLPFPLRALRM